MRSMPHVAGDCVTSTLYTWLSSTYWTSGSVRSSITSSGPPRRPKPFKASFHSATTSPPLPRALLTFSSTSASSLSTTTYSSFTTLADKPLGPTSGASRDAEGDVASAHAVPATTATTRNRLLRFTATSSE